MCDTNADCGTGFCINSTCQTLDCSSDCSSINPCMECDQTLGLCVSKRCQGNSDCPGGRCKNGFCLTTADNDHPMLLILILVIMIILIIALCYVGYRLYKGHKANSVS